MSIKMRIKIVFKFISLKYKRFPYFSLILKNSIWKNGKIFRTNTVTAYVRIFFRIFQHARDLLLNKV